MNKSSLITLSLALLTMTLHSCKGDKNGAMAYGNFESSSTMISAETGGKILYLDLREGEHVKQGAAVALIDTQSLHLQKKKIIAQLNTLPKKLRSAIADISVLEEKRGILLSNLNRSKRLLEKGGASQKSVDDLKAELQVVDKQIAAIRSNIGTANSAILAEQEPIMAQLEIIEDQIKRSTIVNPIAGVVQTKLVETFELVRPGAPLYRIVNMDTLEFRFYVDAVQLQDLKLNQKILVKIDKGQDDYQELPARISWISTKAEFTPKTIQTKKDRVNLVYAVKALVPNNGGLAKIGMPGEVVWNQESQ